MGNENLDEAMVKSITRHWTMWLNLYTLSDGRFWLDDVDMDRQGFVTANQAPHIKRNSHPARGYKPELLSDLFGVYAGGSGRSIEEFSQQFSSRVPLHGVFGSEFDIFVEDRSASEQEELPEAGVNFLIKVATARFK